MIIYLFQIYCDGESEYVATIKKPGEYKNVFEGFCCPYYNSDENNFGPSKNVHV